MRYIQELREGDIIRNEVYLCKSKQKLRARTGKEYGSLILQDKTGTIDAKIWDFSREIGQFDAMDFVHVDAGVTSYQGALQLNITRIYKAQEGEYYPENYLPVSKKNIDEMYQEITAIIGTIKQPNLRDLSENFFIKDIDFVKRFKSHSAAKSVHHGFVGGLLEHTLSVVKLCDFYAANYPIINRDLLLTAALLHDTGKMDELSSFPSNDYTDDGQLLGHIFITTNKISEYVKKDPTFPEGLARELMHCVLAHHGKLEYGSPKKPATIEALALHYADNTDAKLQTMTELLESADEGAQWIGYQRLFETNIMRSSKE